MKTLMIVFLALFAVFGVIGLVVRLTYDWNKLGEASRELDENSIARRDGRAMKILKYEPKQLEPEAERRRDAKKFRLQTIFSVLSALCLIAAMVCGAIIRQG
ncbi:MAG: hypothetical protein ACI4PQ_02115 [Butyricicoccaceae bacterium]